MQMSIVLAIIVGVFFATVLFYPMMADRDRRREYNATLDRYNERYGR